MSYNGYCSLGLARLSTGKVGEAAPMQNLYPVCINLSDKKCLVVGGGHVAERKVKNLIEAQARVFVVSPVLTEWLEQAAHDKKITAVRRNYTTTDLEDAFLVVGATDSHRVNERVSVDCQDRNILVNIVDNPAGCNFIVPAVVRQGALSISVSTDGKSPMLARRIKEKLENEYGPEYQEFLELMGSIREYLLDSVAERDKRKDAFQELVDSDIIDLLKNGQRDKVKERINNVLGNSWTQS